jgi:hypothetical protein
MQAVSIDEALIDVASKLGVGPKPHIVLVGLVYLVSNK